MSLTHHTHLVGLDIGIICKPLHRTVQALHKSNQLGAGRALSENVQVLLRKDSTHRLNKLIFCHYSVIFVVVGYLFIK